MMQAAVGLGPLSVAVDAGSNVFKFYKEGIFDHEDMCGTELNHAINIVGYSSEHYDKKPYWIVRNSWGEDWGEEGYMRMAITDGAGNCGINLEPSFPNIYYMSVFNSLTCLALAVFGALLSIWPIFKLTCCLTPDDPGMNVG